MPLKTLVKVGNISNLSDARYCAGMGAEMLGFSVIEGQDNFINPKSFQEIRGWVSGPSIVAELYGMTNQTNLDLVIENYRPELLELSITDISILPNTSLPLIISIDQSISKIELDLLESIKDRISFLLIDNPIVSFNFIEQTSRRFPVFVMIRSSVNLNELLNANVINGIALNGSQEIKPGLKDYSHLANVLEQLETE
jgi:phosphoribosylanthranilate isomerase